MKIRKKLDQNRFKESTVGSLREVTTAGIELTGGKGNFVGFDRL